MEGIEKDLKKHLRLINCDLCGTQVEHFVPPTGGATGYAVLTEKGGKARQEIACFDCAAEEEARSMIATGKSPLYLVPARDVKHSIDSGLQLLAAERLEPKYYVTNWTGNLRFPVGFHKVGGHNIAGKREDFWFVGPEGYLWHGVLIGDMQLARCKRTKERRCAPLPQGKYLLPYQYHAVVKPRWHGRRHPGAV